MERWAKAISIAMERWAKVISIVCFTAFALAVVYVIWLGFQQAYVREKVLWMLGWG